MTDDTNQPITDAEAAEWKRLCDEATPGPWRSEQGFTHLEIRGPHQTERAVARVYCEIDAALIVVGYDALPRLLAERERLREALLRSRVEPERWEEQERANDDVALLLREMAARLPVRKEEIHDR